jgi:sugar lactone lactonase YvrE
MLIFNKICRRDGMPAAHPTGSYHRQSGVMLASSRHYIVCALALLLAVCILGVSGCDRVDGSVSSAPDVDATFGRTGHGPGEFLYPRALDIADDQTVAVVDKSGRIQRFTPDGKCTQVIDMPEIKNGKPIGLSFAPDGNLYVADTHYHRVLVYSDEGKIVNEFGKYGKEEGCFIYPTDVAFSGDGRIFVGEYGGHDRISVFDKDGKFLSCFGSFGSDEGQLSRPAALCADTKNKLLYIADACNHRIAVYDFEGNLKRYFGSPGTGVGELRNPYDLTILKNGDIAVCEYGNNRIQLFNPEGKSVGIYGTAGRELGQLAYPWAVAADKDDRLFIVDAGNNRVQVWDI